RQLLSAGNHRHLPGIELRQRPRCMRAPDHKRDTFKGNIVIRDTLRPGQAAGGTGPHHQHGGDEGANVFFPVIHRAGSSPAPAAGVAKATSVAVGMVNKTGPLLQPSPYTIATKRRGNSAGESEPARTDRLPTNRSTSPKAIVVLSVRTAPGNTRCSGSSASPMLAPSPPTRSTRPLTQSWTLPTVRTVTSATSSLRSAAG